VFFSYNSYNCKYFKFFWYKIKKEEINSFMKNLLALFLLTISSTFSYAINLAVSSDADYYMYYGTFNSTRTPLFIGVNEQTTSSPYKFHFNVAGIKVNDISGFNSGDTGLLKLNLQRFRVPGTVVPGYMGPPTYSYLTSGVTFTIKAVALTDSFANIESDNDPLAWYNNNLLNRPAQDTVTVNQAGEVTFNITSALNQWKTDPLTNFGIGLIGTYSSIEGTTAQFYSLEYSADLSKLPIVGVIPEPKIIETLLVAGFIFLLFEFIFKKK
jgi:hypothetical protein